MKKTASAHWQGSLKERRGTISTVTLDKDGDGFTITAVHLNMKARIPNIDQATFDKIAYKAKTGCPISKLLNAEISLDATLVN